MARLARVSAVFARALTVEIHSVSIGVAGGIFTSGLVRHVAPVFALTVRLHSVSTGFFVRARWCSPFECTGFAVAGGGIYPHRDRSIRVDASDAHRSDSQTFESVDAQDVHIPFASRSDRQTRPRRACACCGGPGSGVLPGPPTALTVEMHSTASGLVGRISTSVVSRRMTPSVRVWTTGTPKDSNHCAFRR